jgi:hypothetical protein
LVNRTNFEHAGYALLMQLVIGLSTGNWWAGAAFGSAFFLGREHAQAQRTYQLGEFAAFDLRRWSLDARLDLAFPVVAVCLVAFAVGRWVAV